MEFSNRVNNIEYKFASLTSASCMLPRLDFVRCVGYLPNGLRDNKPQNVEGNAEFG